MHPILFTDHGFYHRHRLVRQSLRTPVKFIIKVRKELNAIDSRSDNESK